MTEITSRADIPDAPYYVLCNDSFMSGWGSAKGKINTLILPCRSGSEAEIVAAHARKREDQKYIRIVANKPRINTSRVYYSLHNWDDYSAWYTGDMTITRRISDTQYPFEVRFAGAGFDRRGFNWGGLHKDFWSAFGEAARIAHRCGYRTVEIELVGKL